MNKKEETLQKIIDIVLECCSSNNSVTKSDLLGKCRNENVVMTRCILIRKMYEFGYSISTISSILNRTPQGVRHLMEQYDIFMKFNKVFQLAKHETDLKCRIIIN